MTLAELAPSWIVRTDASMVRGAALRTARWLRPVLPRFGVDPAQFLEVLELRLKLASRDPDGRQSSFASIGLALTLVVAWITGVPVGLAAVSHMQPASWIAIVAAFTLVMIGLMLFTQYGQLLVDGTDVAVLQSRPIADRTLFAARIAHVGIYVAFLCGAIAFWPLALGWLCAPIAYLAVVPLVVALSALLAVGAVALSYAIVLRIAGPASFQRVGFWMQIAGAMLSFVALQSVGYVVHFIRLQDWIAGDAWTRIVLPPLWFGALYDVLAGHLDAKRIVFASAAIAVPLAAVVSSIALASRYFLAALAGEITRIGSRATWRTSFGDRVGRLVCRTRAELAAWCFVGALARRDRPFLRGAVPMAGGLVAALFGSASAVRVMSEDWRARAPAAYLYLLAIVGPGVLEAARFGEHPAARWLFEALPIEERSAIPRAAAKRLFFSVQLPLVVATVLVSGIAAGPRSIPYSIVAAIASSAIALLAVPALAPRYPFSAPQKIGEFDGRTVGVMLGVLGVSALAAVTHLLTSLSPIAFGAYGAAATIALVVAWRRLERVGEPILLTAEGIEVRPSATARSRRD